MVATSAYPHRPFGNSGTAGSRTAASTLLGLLLAACNAYPNHPYRDNELIAQRLSVDYEDLIARTLLYYNQEGGTYCVNVFHKGPSHRLRAKMARLGHALRRCDQELVGLTISRITEHNAGVFHVMLLDQCGALCGVGIRFTLERQENTDLEVVSSRLEAEF